MEDRRGTVWAHGSVVHPACLQRLDGSHRPGGQEPVTRQEIEAILAAMDAMDERWDERIAALEQRWDEWFAAMGERLDTMDEHRSERQEAMDQRWGERLGAMDIRLVEMDKRWQVEGGELREALLGAFVRRLNDAVTRQTRSLTITLMVSVVAIAGSQGQQHLVPVAAHEHMRGQLVQRREPGAAGVCCPASDDRTASGCRHQAPNTPRMMSPWNSGRSSVTGAK